MSMFNLFRRRGSAPVARDRLQILLAHERAGRGQSDLLAILREEILAVIAKHVTVERDNVVVRMDRGATVSTLEIDIEIPTSAGTTACRQTGHVCSYGGEAIGPVEPPTRLERHTTAPFSDISAVRGYSRLARTRSVALVKYAYRRPRRRFHRA